MNQPPIELSLYGVYYPPWLLAAAIGLALAMTLTALGNLTGLSRWIWHPPLFFIALVVVCTILISVTLVPSFFV
ncbi:DUF1656 domain-containing protein [Thiocapsa imhoffii]|uniref:DUF1656 domain-containing protein n=1 Tax=Thiocapsa imhoffii TaxID=382777 RepID=A0A9X0WFZ1_9GAMM|nr:DUF1656 domain-containing protein [Thiocapsa imhoffii]MBK1643860.1 DUF1656 domain-containing protein [Thiocapsa imhoffii]